MSLATAYARVIQDRDTDHEAGHFVQKLLSLMRARGHLSLLSEIVRILERERVDSGAVVTVAHDASLKDFSREIKAALLELGEDKKHQTLVDPRAVGGYSVRANSKIIDNTYRTALVELYQSTIRQ
jgi:F0F1-type ATP synthase delta subunit